MYLFNTAKYILHYIHGVGYTKKEMKYQYNM